MNPSASALIAPGAIVAGKYRLDAVVGEGGMGSVWAATHTGLGQAVAIKFISREFVTSSDALRRFDAEAKAAAQLRSRHVVQVFDNGTLEDGTPYIAMELLRGESVYARVHRAGPVPLHEAAEILLQCCKALGRAHAAGIVHRDIKPDNIFLSQDEDGPVVKILDFGIAKFSAGPNDQGATRTGTVLGTPLYMSPEQARGLKTIDHRTDLYSLGLVAYTMLTGNLAFSSESFGDLLLQICTAPLPSLCANAPWLPPTMDPWFMRACAREPQDRYASAQELGDALRAACSGALPASALPALAQSSPGANAPPQGAAPGISAPNAPGAATASAMSRSRPAGEAASLPRSRGPLVAAIAAAVVGGGAIVALAMTLSAKRAAAPASGAPSGAPVAASVAPRESAARAVEPAPSAVLVEPPAAVVPAADAGRSGGPVAAQPQRPGEAAASRPAASPPAAARPEVRPAAPTPAPPRATAHPARPSSAVINLGY